ncbi:protein kinase [Streptomyces sp. SID4946]|uniref:serine/threonine-protein kinase n=1 Tax=Streptomyces sp. LamerLS-31b TaxID=1839765 RepID=UPI00081E228D|nr:MULTISPECIES: serine/threonine-protein kinase [unclassified Streptomyces]MYQ90512.1 protein kinase [Streptomyces sp. SID4946]SCF57101.1 serine/threonine protein kinase [Streptomyces sp. LamerLS-31b]SCF60788.1 serine/threonine protein kinase [Streptomyces sp. DconLS]
MSEAERAGTSRQETRQGKSGRRLLAGRYRLGDVLGRGGMGTVWRAEDETLGRTVAVKELRFPTNIDEEEKRRLITRTLREAKAIARIRNNSAVTVFDVVDEDDRPWIVMELVEGKSLAEVIREDGVLEPRRAAEVGLAVLDVLRSAHREGILHRDVKPSNVLIADDGRVVLTDFGIAQVEGDPSITSTGMLVGAPSYISPERARGHKPGPAADLWSLGGLLYAAVEGVPPYDKGSAIATLTAVMTEQLDEPKNAGPLRDVIYGLLTKDPAERLDDAGARVLLDKVIHAREPDPLDATRVVPLPAQPAEGGGKRSEEAAEKLRGALRSVRKAAAGAAAGAATGAAADAARPKSGGSASASGNASGKGPGAATPNPAGSPAGNAGSAKPRSGWPVMPPPDLDLPPRPAPKASLTDVVPRRTLVVVAVVVALAVIGTVLAVALSGGDDKDDKGAARTTAGASASAGAGRSKGPAAGTRTDGGSSAPTAAGTGTGTGTGKDVSAGASADAGSAPAVSTRKGGQGYSLGLPKGWSYQSHGSAGDRYTGPDGQKLLVAWTGTPKDDPVADWKSQEHYMVRSQYHRIRIEEADYRGWNTADWEFTYVDGGTEYRTVDRGFVVNDHLGYALMYTAKAGDWDGDLRKDTWKTLTASFKPKS